jgi:hypothetical protein
MPAVSITGLVTTTGTAVATNPFINTEAPFLLIGEAAVPQTCSAIKNAASSAATSDAFLTTFGLAGTQPIKARLTSLKANLALADQGQQLSGKAGFDTNVPGATNVSEFVSSISTTHLPIIKLADTCLQESLQVDTTALTQAQKSVEESKSRLESITNPERNVSYYEGWFPMVRPMTEPALFGLFAAAIFMLLLSILVFLRLSGVQIDIQIPEMAFSLPPNASYYMYGGVVAGIIGGIGYAYYLRR